GTVLGLIIFICASVFLMRYRNYGSRAVQFSLAITVALLVSPYAHFPAMTLLILPVNVAIDEVIRARLRTRMFLGISSVLLLISPYMLISRGRHYWWESSVYLLVLVIAACAAAQLRELKTSPGRLSAW